MAAEFQQAGQCNLQKRRKIGWRSARQNEDEFFLTQAETHALSRSQPYKVKDLLPAQFLQHPLNEVLVTGPGPADRREGVNALGMESGTKRRYLFDTRYVLTLQEQ